MVRPLCSAPSACGVVLTDDFVEEGRPVAMQTPSYQLALDIFALLLVTTVFGLQLQAVHVGNHTWKRI